MSLPTLEEIVVSATPTAPNVAFLTTKSVDGTGVFDILMKSVKLHLMEEYNAGRISGDEYSQVYLGALTAVMQQSVTYLLNHQNEEKLNAEVGLIRQQTVTELANTDDVLPLNLGFNTSSAVLGIIKGKKDIDALQASLVTSQIATADAEEALTGQKIISELANTSTDISLARPIYGFNNENNLVSGLIAMQAAKVAKEGELIDSQVDSAITEKALIGQKIVSELAQTDDDLTDVRLASFGFNSSNTVTGLVKLQKDKVAKEGELIDSQKDSALAEKVLIQQKTVTELASTSDDMTVATTIGLNTSNSIAGLVKSQIDHTTKESLLLDQKVATELAQTHDTIPAGLGAQTAGYTVAGMLAKEKAKLTAEEGLLQYKKNVERAQIADHVFVEGESEGVFGYATTGGYLGKQMTLLEAQKNGYLRDAEQKLSKILVDAWSVDRSMGDANATATNFLDDANLGIVLSKAIAGITT